MFVTNLDYWRLRLWRSFKWMVDQDAERDRRFVLRGVALRPNPICFAKSDRACEGLKGCLAWRSFHKVAGYTFKESAQTPVKRVRWEAREDAMQRYQAASKHGVKAPARTPVAPEHSAA